MLTLTKPRFRKKEYAYWLDGSPLIGTTTALSVLAKELTWWASGMACTTMGWRHPKKNDEITCLGAAGEMLTNIKLMNIREYRDLLNTAYRAHNDKKKSSATEGTDLHSVLEDFIRCRMRGADPLFPDPRIKDFILWADKNVKHFLFTEMCCYSEVLHCAGTADFGYVDMEGRNVLGDFKSSESAYFGHYLQTGAYDLQISENGGWTRAGERIFTLSAPFDRYEIFCFRAGLDKPFVTRETTRLKRAFSFCINLHREKIWWEEAIDKKESGIRSFGK